MRHRWVILGERYLVGDPVGVVLGELPLGATIHHATDAQWSMGGGKEDLPQQYQPLGPKWPYFSMKNSQPLGNRTRTKMMENGLLMIVFLLIHPNNIK